MQHDILVVGIGASAGGIRALQGFFSAVKPAQGIAYIVILHLSPDYNSKLAEVIASVTTIPVTAVTDKVEIAADHIYVVRPNQHLTLDDHHIVPNNNEDLAHRRAPVDILFRCLGNQYGPQAACVILSGSGANGSMGLKYVKEKGGIVYVQDPREAEFNEMPATAIATGLVDEVLKVCEIPVNISGYRRRSHAATFTEKEAAEHNALLDILTRLRSISGQDFSSYKRQTVLRRIGRRMSLRAIQHLHEYAGLLHDHPDESRALLKDLFISVTGFFRDSKAFESLQLNVIPGMFSMNADGGPVRIWVAGCATGEEAYSLAILINEFLSDKNEPPRVQIFATDIEPAAIAKARKGSYSLNDVADVPQERLNRFFYYDGERYVIRREIREMVLFSQHNILKDPPFSRISLVVCRNLLIYLNSNVQEKLIRSLHFSLLPSGFLFLGSAESPHGAGDLFECFDKENRIYRSKAPKHREPLVMGESTRTRDAVPAEDRKSQGLLFGDLHLKLLSAYAPPSLVVNEEYEILHMTDKVGRYLSIPAGEPTRKLLKLVLPELRRELRNSLDEAINKKQAVTLRDVGLFANDRKEKLDIHVRPVFDEGVGARALILVVFEQKNSPDTTPAGPTTSPDGTNEGSDTLRMKLQHAIQEHENKEDELKASNEELHAMNEELRSAAEELETNKEELQSINEELRTVNQELKVRIDEIGNVSNHFQNLINSTDIGTVFLDRNLSVRLFTPAAVGLFNLKTTDQGRAITDITHNLRYDALVQDAENVLDSLAPVEREITTTDNRYFMMRIRPYRTSEDLIDGVVLTFFDITKRRLSENALKRSEESLRLLIESAKDYAIFTLDRSRNIVSWSSGAEQIFGYKEKEIIGKQGDIVFTREDREKGEPFKEASKAILEGRAENERWHQRKDGSIFWGSGITHPLGDEGGYVKIMRDMTEARNMEDALRKSEEKFRRLSESGIVALAFFDTNGSVIEANKAFLDLLGVNEKELRSNKLRWDVYTPKEWMPRTLEALAEFRATGYVSPYEKQFYHADGSLRWGIFAGATVDEANTGVALVVDITERKKAEESLKEREAQLTAIFKALPLGIGFLDKQGQMVYSNEEMKRFLPTNRMPSQDDERKQYWKAFDANGNLVPPERYPGARALKGEHVFPGMEMLYTRENGDNIWTSVSAVPIINDEGDVSGVVSVVTDVTINKKAEEALLESNERLTITMESATDYAIISMDDQRKVLQWSQGAVQLFGYTEEEMIGQSADIIFTEEDKRAGQPGREMVAARETGRAADERWHERKDGSRFFVSGVMRPIRHHNLTGYVKIMRDTTQQQLFTEELHRLAAARTVELQRSNEDLRQFAHVASHDLKEPIRKIKTFNNRILDEFEEVLPTRAKVYCHKVGAAADRMISMIEGVLRYSKMGNNQQSFEWVDLNEVMQQVVTDLEVMIQQKNAEVIFPKLPHLYGSSTLVYQLFYNLMLNALKFSKKDEPCRVTVLAEEVHHEGSNQLKLVFEDNGIGFEQEFAQEIFKTFMRLHPAESYEGTGLGLALCKKIVERHGGSITASGQPGVGATFTIFLPIDPDQVSKGPSLS